MGEYQERGMNTPAACPFLPLVAAVAVEQADLAALLALHSSSNLSHMNLAIVLMSAQSRCQPEFLLPA